jgi:single-strand DNA-binding protein
MLNVIAMQGRLARDPEMRQTTTGKSVASFTLACDRGRKDANGNSQPDWITCTAWEKTAEFICKYFQKGALIAVDGRLQSRQYQDKNGQNRTAIEVVVQNVNFCGKSDSSAHHADRTQGEPNVGYSNGNADDFAEIEDNGDLPF